MTNKITVPVLFGEKKELYTITILATKYERIMNDSQQTKMDWNELKILIHFN